MISADKDYGSNDINLDLTYDEAGRVTGLTEDGHSMAARVHGSISLAAKTATSCTSTTWSALTSA